MANPNANPNANPSERGNLPQGGQPSPYGSQVPTGYDRGGAASPGGMPPYGQPPKRRRVGLIIGIVAIVLPLVIATVALVSCMAKYDSPPINEDAETVAFLEDVTVNDDDLRVFDGIRPAIEKNLAHSRVTGYSEDKARRMVDEIRASIESGRWDCSPAWGTSLTYETFPLEWVRLCELAEKEMHKRTSETWHVVDFGYPSPSNGPIPVPATYNDGSAVAMRMECMTGRYEGLVVGINYFRWAEKPHYVSYEEEARKRFDQMEEDIKTLRTLLPDHEFLCSYGRTTDGQGYEEDEEDEENSEKYVYTLHVWEKEDEQELSDVRQFAAQAQRIFEVVPHVERVLTLAPDYEVDLNLVQIHNYNYEDTSTVRPDPPSAQGVAEAQGLCLRNHYLYQQPNHDEGGLTPSQQLGVSRTDMGDDGQVPPESVWGARRNRKRIEAARVSLGSGHKLRDEDMIRRVSEILGIPESHVLVLFEEEEEETNNRLRLHSSYVVFIPARETGMTPERFHEVAIEIEDALLDIHRNRNLPKAPWSTSDTVWLSGGTIWAVDETDAESILVDGTPMSFEELCRQQSDEIGTEIDMRAWLTSEVYAHYNGENGERTHNEVKEEEICGEAYEVL